MLTSSYHLLIVVLTVRSKIVIRVQNGHKLRVVYPHDLRADWEQHPTAQYHARASYGRSLDREKIQTHNSHPTECLWLSHHCKVKKNRKSGTICIVSGRWARTSNAPPTASAEPSPKHPAPPLLASSHPEAEVSSGSWGLCSITQEQG